MFSTIIGHTILMTPIDYRVDSAWCKDVYQFLCASEGSLIARFMGPTWGPPGADRTQVGPMWVPMKIAIWVVILMSALWNIWTQLNLVLQANLWYKAHQIPKLKCFSSRLADVFAHSIEVRCWVRNEDVVGAAPTGNAPTTSEWSTILLPPKVPLLLFICWTYLRSVPNVFLSNSVIDIWSDNNSYQWLFIIAMQGWF